MSEVSISYWYNQFLQIQEIQIILYIIALYQLAAFQKLVNIQVMAPQMGQW